MLYFLCLTPVFLAVIYLISALAFNSDSVFSGTILYHLPPLILALFPFAWFAVKYRFHFFQLRENFWLYLCFLAPLAVIYPWVITSGPPASGSGGYLFFADWLTKYPNLGPINFHVLLGMISVVGAAFLPSLYAFLALVDEENQNKLIVITAINLVCFVAVFLRLDLMLWIMGFSPQPSSSFSVIPFDVIYGPLLHTVPFIIMLWHTISMIMAKPLVQR